jgi:glycosyltransferase involved in cell wall biosynthesis
MTSPSRALVELLSRRWGFDAGLAQIVPYSVDESWFRPPANPGSGPHQQPVILCVGSLGKTKGTRVLLDAFARVHAAVPAARLRLIGHLRNDRDIDEPTYQDYVSRQLGPGVAARVEFAGRLPHRQLLHEYQACAVATVPSVLFDNHPNTCLEAMACGRPVVGSDSGGIPEMVHDGVTGRIVPAGDSAALAAALVELLLDRPRAEQMGLAGRRRVEERYARPVIVQRQIKAYLQATERLHAW